MIKLFQILLITVLYVASSRAQTQNLCFVRCPDVIQPVCGSDKKSYKNWCELAKASCRNLGKTTFAYQGRCGRQAQNQDSCNLQCPDIIQPVCGSNGKTYRNWCRLARASCRSLGLIKFAHQGRCGKKAQNQNSCFLKCPDIIQPVCGSDKKTYRNWCTLAKASCNSFGRITFQHQGRCGKKMQNQNPCNVKCQDIIQPVCGSNKKSYKNWCKLAKDSCRSSGLITFKHQGRCGKKFLNDNSCSVKCPDIIQPVCATNRRTYKNWCELAKASCRSFGRIKFAHQGRCGRKTQNENSCGVSCPMRVNHVCGTDQKTYRNWCTLARASCRSLGFIKFEKLGKCDPFNWDTDICKVQCPDMIQPICGSDRKSYKNWCELAKASCKSEGKITFKHQGRCGRKDLHENTCTLKCPTDVQPVCGSNRKTYLNWCLLARASCRSFGSITFAHRGRCRTKNCPRSCSNVRKQVCGTNNVTYRNLCRLNQASCRKNFSIKVKNFGACKKFTCPKMCTMEYNPQCGTDGITYSNMCNFRAVACRNSQIKIAYAGKCRRNTVVGNNQNIVKEIKKKPCDIMCQGDYEPVCGTDDRNYANMCLLNVRKCQSNGKIQLKHKGQCARKCARLCPGIYNPHCGTDGVTYANKCLLLIQTCKTNGKIKQKHVGRCGIQA